MYAREQALGFRTLENPQSLIVPASIHDGDTFPEIVQKIQRCDLTNYSNVRIADNSPTHEALAACIRNWVPDIVTAIEKAPVFNEKWEQLAYNNFISQFRKKSGNQVILPNLG
jgi:hypothetical protein